MSPEQLRNLREKAARTIEAYFETEITINGINLAAARFKASSGTDNELAGLLPTANLTLRVRRQVLVEKNITITPQRTTLTEQGKEYRVDEIFDSNGDPALVLACRAI